VCRIISLTHIVKMEIPIRKLPPKNDWLEQRFPPRLSRNRACSPRADLAKATQGQVPLFNIFLKKYIYNFFFFFFFFFCKYTPAHSQPLFLVFIKLSRASLSKNLFNLKPLNPTHPFFFFLKKNAAQPIQTSVAHEAFYCRYFILNAILRTL
jgi:hypothetical protein